MDKKDMKQKVEFTRYHANPLPSRAAIRMAWSLLQMWSLYLHAEGWEAPSRN